MVVNFTCVFFHMSVIVLFWCVSCLFCDETDESEAGSSGDVKSRLKKKAVSGLQRKDSMYYTMTAPRCCFRFSCYRHYSSYVDADDAGDQFALTS